MRILKTLFFRIRRTNITRFLKQTNYLQSFNYLE